MIHLKRALSLSLRTVDSRLKCDSEGEQERDEVFGSEEKV